VGEYLIARPFGDKKFDLAIEFGTRGDMGELELPREPTDPSLKNVAVGIDTAMLGRTRPLALAVVADIREALREVMVAVKSMAPPARLQKLRTDRLAAVQPYAASQLASVRDNAKKNFDHSPIHPDRLAYEIEQAIDPDAI